MGEQPFYIGQKVICIKGDKRGIYKKDSVYTVKNIELCSRCGMWWVGCMLHPLANGDSFCDCGQQSETSYWQRPASTFAPVNEGFQPISFTKVLEEELVSSN